MASWADVCEADRGSLKRLTLLINRLVDALHEQRGPQQCCILQLTMKLYFPFKFDLSLLRCSVKRQVRGIIFSYQPVST